MSSEPLATAISVAEMQRAFDQVFAEPVRTAERSTEDYIRLRAGGELFAVKALDTAGIVRARRIAPIPSRLAEMTGLAAARGRILPVFDLASLMGLAPGGSGVTFLLLVPYEVPIALGFEAFEGVSRAHTGERPVPRTEMQGRQIVRLDARLLPLIDIRGILMTIRQRSGLSGPAKEQKTNL